MMIVKQLMKVCHSSEMIEQGNSALKPTLIRPNESEAAF